MELKILRISMSNFKGVKNKEIVLDGKSARLCAQNGRFKTTTADAFYFLFCDCNTALVKNPPITPLGQEECESRVEIEISIDEKICNVVKVQKFKQKTEDDGRKTSSITNTYEINSVSKSQKDFYRELQERGIDTEHFLILSNPNALLADTSKAGREKIREILFSMTGDISDTDIAKDVKADDVVELLDNYTLAEIEQMHKATIKKITDSMGKDNSIINARIEEVKKQKSTQDAAVLQEQKKSYEAEIDRIDKELADMGNSNKEAKFVELTNKLNIIKAEMDCELVNQKSDLDRQYRDKLAEAQGYERNVNEIQTNLDNAIAEQNRLNEDIKKQRTLYKMEQGAVLDESDLSCPVCHIPYTKDKLAKIKAEFDKNKAKRVKLVKATGDELKAKIEANKGLIDELKHQLIEMTAKLDECKTEVDSLLVQLNALPKIPDYMSNKEYKKIYDEIEKITKDLAKSDKSKKTELESQRNVNKQMLNQVVSELAFLDKNIELDKRIEELREERKTNEVNKAKAEKIIDQVEKVKQSKNEKLTESINKHFNVINFKLFDYLKNGNYTEIVEIMVDGKPISSSANGSLIQFAKIDCISGLQNFFDQHLPVFLEDAALLTINTKNRIKLDAQLIQLVATDGVTELEVCDG